MKSLLISTLETLGYPVILQGSMTADEPYPESFITFQTMASPEQDFFDGLPHGVQWRYAVIFYTSNPDLMSTVPAHIYNLLRSAGFIPKGRGYDIPSDEPTHSGWVNEYYYLEV